MKKLLVIVLVAGYVMSVYATTARILSMGKRADFFMDETSIFTNPANVNIYPNMLMGSPGEYRYVAPQDTSNSNNWKALARTNKDPQDPFFGGILSYSLKQSSEEGSQYPLLSIAGVFNRKDPMLSYLTPATYVDTNQAKNWKLPDPVGKIDLIVGYAFQNGGMIGIGTYIATQTGTKNNAIDSMSSLYKGTIGVNWPVAKSMDLEGSIGISSLSATSDSGGISESWGKNDIGVQGDLRLFSALTMLNGDFVPHISFKELSIEKDNKMFFDLAAGLGLNINIDKGFFWAGLEGLYGSFDTDNSSLTKYEKIGGRVGFGIERNVVWDWAVVRVGVTKSLVYVNENGNVGYWAQNPEADGSNDDIVGFGIGLNVENRLKFDILVAEDVVYTLTNLFSGPMDHIFTRIDATFSF